MSLELKRKKYGMAMDGKMKEVRMKLNTQILVTDGRMKEVRMTVVLKLNRKGRNYRNQVMDGKMKKDEKGMDANSGELNSNTGLQMAMRIKLEFKKRKSAKKNWNSEKKNPRKKNTPGGGHHRRRGVF
jgi:hypothetical protein